jgi:cytochrome c oxidase assembly factor CtaG
VHRPFGPGPINDQRFGGSLMWAGSMLIDSIWVVLAVLHWLRSEQRKAYRLDVQTLAGLGGAQPFPTTPSAT